MCTFLFTSCIVNLNIVNLIIYARKLCMLIVPMHLYFVLFIVYYTCNSTGFLELGRLFTSRCQLFLECIGIATVSYFELLRLFRYQRCFIVYKPHINSCFHNSYLVYQEIDIVRYFISIPFIMARLIYRTSSARRSLVSMLNKAKDLQVIVTYRLRKHPPLMF